MSVENKDVSLIPGLVPPKAPSIAQGMADELAKKEYKTIITPSGQLLSIVPNSWVALHNADGSFARNSDGSIKMVLRTIPIKLKT